MNDVDNVIKKVAWRRSHNGPRQLDLV